MATINTRDDNSSANPLPIGGQAQARLFILNAEPRLRNAIEQILRREGLQVDVVAGGYEALSDHSVKDLVQKGRITLRHSERRVLFDNKEVRGLTPKEYALLLELVVRSPRVVEKCGLVIKIWG